MARRLIHAITPGDHFSPSTGSAVPTVVHGLCKSWPSDEPRPAVLVAAGTYADRYDSADALEYGMAPAVRGRAGVAAKVVDLVAGRVGLPRYAARRQMAAMLVDQERWEPSTVVAHNLPQLVPLVSDRHLSVLYVHNQLFARYSKREAGRTLDRVHRIVAVSDYMAEATKDRLPTSLHDRVVVVRNGIAFDEFAAEPRPRTGPLEIVFVGRVVPDKGVHVLVEALCRMRNRHEVRLLVIGSSGFSAVDPLTSYERGLRTLARDVAEIEFQPFLPREQIADQFRKAHVVVVPSTWPEPFALTTLEGMASGNAVVASKVGGIPETLNDVGLIVEPNDPIALAQALDALAIDDTVRLNRAEASTKRARARDWSVVVRELRSVLSST